MDAMVVGPPMILAAFWGRCQVAFLEGVTPPPSGISNACPGLAVCNHISPTQGSWPICIS